MSSAEADEGFVRGREPIFLCFPSKLSALRCGLALVV